MRTWYVLSKTAEIFPAPSEKKRALTQTIMHCDGSPLHPGISMLLMQRRLSRTEMCVFFASVNRPPCGAHINIDIGGRGGVTGVAQLLSARFFRSGRTLREGA